MELGLVGLGKMGGNMRERIRRAGHEVVGSDRLPPVFERADDGAPTYVSHSALPEAFLAPEGAGIPTVDSGLAGTLEEQQLVGALVGLEDGQDATLTTLLVGPMMRGTVVSE